VSYFPSINKGLVVALQQQFPDKCPDLDLTEKEVWFRAGQASVARWLDRKLEEQEDNVYQIKEVA